MFIWCFRLLLDDHGSIDRRLLINWFNDWLSENDLVRINMLLSQVVLLRWNLWQDTYNSWLNICPHTENISNSYITTHMVFVNTQICSVKPCRRTIWPRFEYCDIYTCDYMKKKHFQLLWNSWGITFPSNNHLYVCVFTITALSCHANVCGEFPVEMMKTHRFYLWNHIFSNKLPNKIVTHLHQ